MKENTLRVNISSEILGTCQALSRKQLNHISEKRRGDTDRFEGLFTSQGKKNLITTVSKTQDNPLKVDENKYHTHSSDHEVKRKV